MPTVVKKESIGLVTVSGTDYYIADIGMRMLTPRRSSAPTTASSSASSGGWPNGLLASLPQLAAIDVEPDFFASIEALLDRSDDLHAHGDPFEQHARILTLFAPDD